MIVKTIKYFFLKIYVKIPEISTCNLLQGKTNKKCRDKNAQWKKKEKNETKQNVAELHLEKNLGEKKTGTPKFPAYSLQMLSHCS